MRELFKIKDGRNLKGSAGSELMQFFLGFVMFAAGLFWLLNTFEIHTSFGRGYYIGSMRMNTGVILIPLLVGVGLLFFLEGRKMIIGAAVAAAGLLLILVSLISSISITVRHTSLLSFLLMFGMIAAGAGLVFKTAFHK